MEELSSDYSELLREHVDLERENAALQLRLGKIKTLCLRHNNPSVTTGVQLFAGLVLKVIEESEVAGGR